MGAYSGIMLVNIARYDDLAATPTTEDNDFGCIAQEVKWSFGERNMDLVSTLCGAQIPIFKEPGEAEITMPLFYDDTAISNKGLIQEFFGGQKVDNPDTAACGWGIGTTTGLDIFSGTNAGGDVYYYGSHNYKFRIVLALADKYSEAGFITADGGSTSAVSGIRFIFNNAYLTNLEPETFSLGSNGSVVTATFKVPKSNPNVTPNILVHTLHSSDGTPQIVTALDTYVPYDEDTIASC